MLANEMSIPGKTEAEVWAFVDKIINAMNATVKSGLAVSEDDVLPGPIKLRSKAATVYKRAMDDKYQSDRGIGVRCGIRAGGLGGERARPPCHHRADWRICRSNAIAWSMLWAKEDASFRSRRFATACLPRRQLVTCASTTRPFRLPKAAVRQRLVWRRRWPRH